MWPRQSSSAAQSSFNSIFHANNTRPCTASSDAHVRFAGEGGLEEHKYGPSIPSSENDDALSGRSGLTPSILIARCHYFVDLLQYMLS